MYDIVYDKMVDSKVATMLILPVFMNNKREEVDELNWFEKV